MTAPVRLTIMMITATVLAMTRVHHRNIITVIVIIIFPIAVGPIVVSRLGKNTNPGLCALVVACRSQSEQINGIIMGNNGCD